MTGQSSNGPMECQDFGHQNLPHRIWPAGQGHFKGKPFQVNPALIGLFASEKYEGGNGLRESLHRALNDQCEEFCAAERGSPGAPAAKPRQSRKDEL